MAEGLLSELHYKPSAWGQEFHDLPHNEALGAGAAGVGKSIVLLHEADKQIFVEHQRCLDRHHPHHIKWGSSVGWALYLRRTTKMLKTNLQRARVLFPRMDPGVRFSEQELTFTFSSGFKYQFGHCKDPGDWDIYQGNEYSLILFDELVQFLEEQYEQIRSRLRTDDPVLREMLKCRGMSNPTMIDDTGEDFVINDPFWVRRKFVDGCRDGRKTFVRTVKLRNGKVRKHTWIYLPATLEDNPNTQFREDYEATLRSLPQHIQEALLEGNWYFVAGSFFSAAWRPRMHVCDPFVVPKDWPLSRSMDWGYRTHGVIHWWAHSPEGTLFCIREYKFRMKKADQVAARMTEIEKDLGCWKGKRSEITGPADTQIWEHRGGVGKSVVQTFRECGISWAKANKLGGSGADKFGRAANARRLLERLNDHSAGKTMPGIVFFRNCRYIITTLPSILIDPSNPEAPAKGGDDHGLDSVLYECAFASKHKGTVPKAARGSAARDEDEDDETSRVDRGQLGYG